MESSRNIEKDAVKVIGLTGGIGTGKSTAAEYLKKRGFAHIDADAIGHELTAEGSTMLPVLDSVFGPKGEMGKDGIKILNEDGTLDRKALASIVFTDDERKARLDDIMLKNIIAEMDKRTEGYKRLAEEGSKRAECEENEPGEGACGEQITGILLDAPLLFEAGLDDRCDLVLLIVADMDVRIARVCARDGATAEEVRDRINCQMSDAEKMEKSDVIADNSKGLTELYQQLDAFIAEFVENN